MREAAERRQQLELEHEQALAVLSAKQQEIDLLQKVRGQGFQPHHTIGSSYLRIKETVGGVHLFVDLSAPRR